MVTVVKSGVSGRNGGSRRGAAGLRAAMVLCAALAVIPGCGGDPILRKNGQYSARPYALANIAKGDVDLITELAQQEVLAGLRRMTEKLYRRNPQEYRKVSGVNSPEMAADRIFGQIQEWGDSPLARIDWMETLRLAFMENYRGDRVNALMSALTSMIMASYNHQTEFFLTDTLDAQSLYNSARNVETAAWKLAQSRRRDGSPFLVSNSMEPEPPNLSFEREFGRIIGHQDLLALVMEDKSNRAINRVLHNMATFVLLPI